MTPSDLTTRQREVAALVAVGFTNKHIAGMKGITTRRVQVIVSSIAFAIQCPPEQDERVAIARWWAAFALRTTA